MSPDEFTAYKQRLLDFVEAFVDEVEAKIQQPFDLAIGHHCFINAMVLVELSRRREAAGKPTIPVACFVHGTALKMYQKQADAGDHRFQPVMADTLKHVRVCFAISEQQKALMGNTFPEYPPDDMSSPRTVSTR